MHALDVRLRLTFIRRALPGCDKPVINILSPTTQVASDILTVRISRDADLPAEAQWVSIEDALRRGVTVSLACVDFDHCLDVFRAVAIETGRVADPDLLRSESVA